MQRSVRLQAVTKIPNIRVGSVAEIPTSKLDFETRLHSHDEQTEEIPVDRPIWIDEFYSSTADISETKQSEYCEDEEDSKPCGTQNSNE